MESLPGYETNVEPIIIPNEDALDTKPSVIFEKKFEGGWIKQIVARNSNQTGGLVKHNDIYVYAPPKKSLKNHRLLGKKLRSSADLLKWLLDHPNQSEHFDPKKINFENPFKKTSKLSFGTTTLIDVVKEIKNGIPLHKIKSDHPGVQKLLKRKSQHDQKQKQTKAPAPTSTSATTAKAISTSTFDFLN